MQYFFDLFLFSVYNKAMLNKQTVKKVTFVIILIAMAILTVLLFPFFNALKSPEGMASFEAHVKSYGFWGVLLLLAIQVLQILVAVIPGEIVEFIAGAMYGTWGGTALCLVGVVIGEWILFEIVKVFGMPLLTSLFDVEKINKYKFISDSSRLKTLVFYLYFIPGTPKDLLCFFMPLTPISRKDFLIISTLARTFSVLSSAYAGATFSKGDWVKTAIAYAVIGLVSAIGIFVHNRFFSDKRR